MMLALLIVCNTVLGRALPSLDMCYKFCAYFQENKTWTIKRRRQREKDKDVAVGSVGISKRTGLGGVISDM